jgi:uncharacterized Tic20 family protein
MNPHSNDHTAAFAAAFFIGNLLFVGIFYIALWLLYFLRYKNASPITKNHFEQAIAASSLSTFIFVAINAYILLTGGYATLTGLLSLELYFMLVVPVFMLLGILAFVKAVQNKDFRYPVIGKLLNLKPIQ